jgi:hypothetical protein
VIATLWLLVSALLVTVPFSPLWRLCVSDVVVVSFSAAGKPSSIAAALDRNSTRESISLQAITN